MGKQLSKYTYLPIIVAILITTVLLAFLLVWLNSNTAKHVRDVALTVAMQDCTRRQLGKYICNNLVVEVSPPPAFGRDYWLAYVVSADKKQFSASMRVDVNWGKASVSEYAYETK